jgi:putative ABC transport system permease protein
MIEGLHELFDDLVRNPLRTALTAASVAWGTFMLVTLLGLSEGLQNSVRWQFRDDATNSVWLFRGKTSMAYQGHPVGRNIVFDDYDLELLRGLPNVEYLSGRFYPPRRDVVVSWNDRRANFGMRAVHPDHQVLENTQVVAGRYLDDLDLAERRKVVVIGREVATYLFRERSDPRVLGEWVDIGGTLFRVVGIFEDDGGTEEMSEVYLPLTTARVVYKGGDQLHQLMFTVGDATLAEAEAVTEAARVGIGRAHHIHPDDRKALRVRNNLESFQQVSQVFDQLAAFTWVVGIGTVLAGIVGVSNIMLVSVRERTHEIGLRKALGATPANVVGGVVREAVLLTAVSGYAGVVAGVVAIQLIAAFLPENETLREPSVDLGVALGAVVALTAAGAVAGFVPAWRAASVRPIEALRSGG